MTSTNLLPLLQAYLVTNVHNPYSYDLESNTVKLDQIIKGTKDQSMNLSYVSISQPVVGGKSP